MPSKIPVVTDLEAMEEKAEEVRAMAKLKDDTTLGYAKYRIWPFDKLCWGHINDRTIDRPRKVDMSHSYVQSGIQATKNDTCIALPMEPQWISCTPLKTQNLDVLQLGDIPELELTDEGLQALEEGLIQPLEGLGRRGGIEILYEQLTKEIVAMEKQLKKLNDTKSKNGDKALENINEDIVALTESIAFQKERREEKTWWTFRLLNLCELHDVNCSVDVLISFI